MIKRINIFGDVSDNQKLVIHKNDILSDSINIVNLEGVIDGRNKSKKIKKLGPHINIDTTTIDNLRYIGFNLFNLSNNHINDYGPVGMHNSIKYLEDSNLEWFGLSTSSCSKRFKIIDMQDKKVAVLTYSEYEFNLSDLDNSPNIYNEYEIFRDFESVKPVVDYIIVLFHGGKERVKYPSSDLKTKISYFASLGADFVLCQHNHIDGNLLRINDTVVLLGQGDFLSSLSSNENNGYMCSFSIDNDKSLKMNMYKFIRNDVFVDLELINDIKVYSLDDNLIDLSLYKKSLDKEKDYYISQLFCFNYFQKKIYHYFPNLLRKKINKHLLYHVNFFRCDAHRDAIKTLLGELYEES